MRVTSQINPQWFVQLDLLQFYRNAIDAPAYMITGQESLGTAKGSSSRSLGAEVDLNLRFQISKITRLATGASVLFPGAYLTDQFGDSHPFYYYAEIESRF